MVADIKEQIFELLILAIPVASISRTIVFEELFREFHERFVNLSKSCKSIFARKFFYLFTCDYCFSHYVTLLFIWLFNFRLIVDDWRGSVVAFFSVVFCANIYLNIYARLKVDIRQVKTETKKIEKEIVAEEHR